MRLPLGSLGLTIWLGLISCLGCAESADEAPFPRGGAADAGHERPEDRPSAGDLAGGQPILDDGDAGPTPPECARERSVAELGPVRLIFLLDQSGSMGDGLNGSPDEKWEPVTQALMDFFANADDSALSASLTLFPPSINSGELPASRELSGPELCRFGSYAVPGVAMTALPEPNLFAEAMAQATPPNEWGTPTQLALQGAIFQAEQIASLESDARVAIVMVTDGEPTYCDVSNSIDGAAELAGSVSSTIPTFVVGVGDDLSALNQIAVSGGTEEAFLVPVDDPTAVRARLLDSFNALQRRIGCRVTIPDPPKWRRFDKERVAVEVDFGDDAPSAIDYNQSCAKGIGWRYDDPADPTEIRLCAETCDTVRRKSAVGLSVVFACKTLIRVR
jgi:hypothetical protein